MRLFGLKENERMVRVVRRYGLTHAFDIVVIALFFGLAFFFLFWFFRHGIWGQTLFAALVGIGVVLLIRLLFTRYRNVTYVTDRRLVDIDRRGFFHCVISDIPYDQIEDVSGHMRGFFGTVFRYGDVHIQTGGGTVRIVIDRVVQPRRLQGLINDLREAYVRDRTAIGVSDVMRWIRHADRQELQDAAAAIEQRLAT